MHGEVCVQKSHVKGGVEITFPSTSLFLCYVIRAYHSYVKRVFPFKLSKCQAKHSLLGALSKQHKAGEITETDIQSIPM